MIRGLLVINLGTPTGAEVPAVRRYLSQFLSDKRVIDLPYILRMILVYVFILPFRPKKSAHAYQLIWTAQGSPLLHYSNQLVHQLQKHLGPEQKIVLGMRYGSPSIEEALEQLKHCDSITILPLYPQYSSAATGSSLEEVMTLIKGYEVIPSLNIIRDFYQHPAYINAQAGAIEPYCNQHTHLLFSYHGLPERQINKSGCKQVCEGVCPAVSDGKSGCYRAQCYDTSRLLAAKLGLKEEQYSTSFQSRLGRTPWIKPYTDEHLSYLAASGVTHLTVACPSFVTDCLETLEEIGIRAKQQWLDLGGEDLILVPCMNDEPQWIEAILEIIR